MRKTAPNGTIVPGRNHIKQVSKLWHDMHKIAVHRKDVAPGRRLVAVSERAADTARRSAVEQLDTSILVPHCARYIRGRIRAVIVHQDNFANVAAVHLQQGIHQRSYIHLLVVAGDDDRNGSGQTFVMIQRHARPACVFIAGLLRPYIKSSADLAHPRSMFQKKRQVAHPLDEKTRCEGMDYIVRNDLEMSKPLMGG